MDLRLQYARASDGARLAFTTLGNGPPLLVTTAPAFSNIRDEWDIPDMRAWYEAMARNHTLILYDGRGAGAADRNVTDLGQEAHALDIEAVVSRLNLDSLDIFGFYHTCVAAIIYAATHPEKVRRLVLWHGYARAADLQSSAQVEAVRSLLGASWEVYTETLARTLFGWTSPSASRWASMVRRSTTAAAVADWIEHGREFDVTEYLPRVACPTLLLYRKEARRFSADLGLALASQIPGAQLQLLPGEAMGYFAGDREGVVAVLEDFLGDGMPRGLATHTARSAGRIVTILFTDLEEHTALMRRLGDEHGRAVLREHETIVRDALRRHGGAEIKALGDGFMASFDSSHRALECAVDLQRTFAARNETATVPLRVRIGLNAGEPIAEDDDLFGSAVILAARTAARAKGGEIVVTDVVRQLAAGKDFLFSDLGTTEIRGFEDPVRLFELGWH